MNKPDSVVEIFLQPGEFYFGDSHTRIRTTLGSCVSITMWHPKRLIGGMCHYMLASNRPTSRAELNGKYGEDAVTLLLQNAAYHDTSPSEYVFKIFGGGNMFPAENGSWPCNLQNCDQVFETCRNVSCRNSNAGRALLKQHGLNVAVEHLGGTGHRNLIFDIWNGDVWMRHSPIMTKVG